MFAVLAHDFADGLNTVTFMLATRNSRWRTITLLIVDALAGHFDDVVRTGERFRAGWERAGRPVAPNLARTSYAVAMLGNAEEGEGIGFIRPVYDYEYWNNPPSGMRCCVSSQFAARSAAC